MPLVAAAPGLHRDHTRAEAPILGQERSAEDVHNFDAVDRHAGAEGPRGRVRDIRLVDEQRAPLFARSVDPEPSPGRSHDSRQQRQRVVHGGRTRGQVFDILAGLTGVACEDAVGAARYGIVNLYAVMPDRG